MAVINLVVVILVTSLGFKVIRDLFFFLLSLVKFLLYSLNPFLKDKILYLLKLPILSKIVPLPSIVKVLPFLILTIFSFKLIVLYRIKVY